MKISNIEVVLRNDARVRALVAFVIEDCFRIRGLKVVEGPDGLVVELPTRRRADGSTSDIHPIQYEVMRELQTIILAAYRSARGEADGFEGTGVRAQLLPPIGPLSARAAKVIPRDPGSTDLSVH